MAPVLVAFDPSMTAFGWCAVRLGTEPELVAAGVIETAPTPKSKRGSVAEDDARRVRFIRRELVRVMREHAPAIVAVEAAAGSKSAKVAAALARAQAIAACVVDEHLGEGQALYVTALEGGDAAGVQRTQRVARPKGPDGEALPKAKGEADRQRKARKAEIARAVVHRFGIEAWMRGLGVSDADAVRHRRYEGAHDAAAIALAAFERPEVAAVRRLAGVA